MVGLLIGIASLRASVLAAVSAPLIARLNLATAQLPRVGIARFRTRTFSRRPGRGRISFLIQTRGATGTGWHPIIAA